MKEKVHPVETQWHYPIMTAYGFEAETKEKAGMVRSYVYAHPDTGYKIRIATGVSSDHWSDLQTGKTGLWKDLEPHLESIKK